MYVNIGNEKVATIQLTTCARIVVDCDSPLISCKVPVDDLKEIHHFILSNVM